MSLLKITSHDHRTDILKFDLNHSSRKPIYTALANGIRRTIISEVPSIAINRRSVVFHANTSMLHNEILSHRLILIPFVNSYLQQYNLEQLELSLNITNNEEHMIDVLASDFVITNNESRTPIDMDKAAIYPDILFGKLKPTQEINLTASFHIGTHKTNGAHFSVVSCTTYEFKKDISAINKAIRNLHLTTQSDIKHFQIAESQRYFLKDSDDNPLTYEFTIEPIGNIKSKQIFSYALTVMIDQLNNIKTAINDENTNVIQISPSDTTVEQFSFNLFGFDDTMGNLIAEYLYYNNKTNFASYYIPHPLDDLMIIRMSLITKNTIEENISVFIDQLTSLISIISDLKSTQF
jgi:DNA-directed RNA polymerase subunit L